MKAIPNRPISCDYDVKHNNEKWHIFAIWKRADGEVAWYEGRTIRNGVSSTRIFSPSEIRMPHKHSRTNGTGPR